MTENVKATAAKRTAIVLDPAIQDRVADLAKNHKLNQGQVIEVMLDMLTDKPDFIEALKSKREQKVSSRTGKTAILKKLSKLSADQLEALAAQLKDEE
jgi:hypothetical protein